MVAQSPNNVRIGQVVTLPKFTSQWQVSKTYLGWCLPSTISISIIQIPDLMQLTGPI